MKTLLVTVASLLTLAVLSGCTYESPKQVVDFSNVDASQPGASFELEVKVVGLRDGSIALPDAFVGVAKGDQALAKSTTGPDGVALLRIKSGQTVRVVASAEGWTTEQSGPIGIGRAPQQETNLGGFGCSGGAVNSADGQTAGGSCDNGFFRCSGGSSNSAGGQASGGSCIVTAGADDAASGVELDGDRGAVSLVLFPSFVEQTFEFDVGPNLNARATTLPDGESWLAQHKPLQEDPALHDLQMLRFQDASTTLTWTRTPLEHGDFELGLGCQAGSPDAETDELMPRLVGQGTMELQLEFSPENDGRWSSCADFYAGPIVDSVNTPITVKVASTLHFVGRSTIIPIGE